MSDAHDFQAAGRAVALPPRPIGGFGSKSSDRVQTILSLVKSISMR